MMSSCHLHQQTGAPNVPILADEMARLAACVDEHLKKMGFA
jgi:hypothetical protein